jgi:hypothetical protein
VGLSLCVLDQEVPAQQEVDAKTSLQQTVAPSTTTLPTNTSEDKIVLTTAPIDDVQGIEAGVSTPSHPILE